MATPPDTDAIPFLQQRPLLVAVGVALALHLLVLFGYDVRRPEPPGASSAQKGPRGPTVVLGVSAARRSGGAAVAAVAALRGPGDSAGGEFSSIRPVQWADTARRIDATPDADAEPAGQDARSVYLPLARLVTEDPDPALPPVSHAEAWNFRVGTTDLPRPGRVQGSE